MPRVYTQIPLADRFWSKVRKTDTCWLWTAARQTQGYGVIGIPDGYGDGHLERAHRVSWELHNGPIPKEMWVLHKCDVPACVRPDHLFLGTQTENMADASRKGRTSTTHNKQGRNHWNARLTIEDVLAIRERRHAGERLAAIAKDFGISEAHVSRIARGSAWVSLSKPSESGTSS